MFPLLYVNYLFRNINEIVQSINSNSSAESNVGVPSATSNPLPLPLIQLEMKHKFPGYINQFFMNEGNKHKCIFFNRNMFEIYYFSTILNSLLKKTISNQD